MEVLLCGKFYNRQLMERLKSPQGKSLRAEMTNRN